MRKKTMDLAFMSVMVTAKQALEGEVECESLWANETISLSHLNEMTSSIHSLRTIKKE